MAPAEIYNESLHQPAVRANPRPPFTPAKTPITARALRKWFPSKYAAWKLGNSHPGATAWVPDQVVRTVTENCRTLKFTDAGFEES